MVGDTEHYADEVDLANKHMALETEYAVAAIRQNAVSMDPGEPGECDGCGFEYPRLVGGLCGFCRDGRPVPFGVEL